MIDAFTIGITIALEDGVSAGVAAIRQDLLALDQAIQASAAGLLALRRLGQQIGVVGTGEPPPALSHAPPAMLLAAGTTTPTTDPASFSTSRTIPTPDIASPTEAAPITVATFAPGSLSDAQTNVRNAAPPQSNEPERSPIAPAPVLNHPQRRAVQPARPQPIASPASSPELPDQRSDGQVQAVHLRRIAEFAPSVLPVAQKAAGNPSLDRPSPPVDDALSTFTAVPPPSKSSSAAPVRAALLQPPTRFDRAQRPVSVMPDTKTEPPRSSGPAAAAYVRPEHQLLRPVSDEQRPDRATPASPPSREETHPARLTGEIMLDGSRFGRWVADAITRMAERAPYGSTGIDPRASPGWPAIQAD